MLSLNEIRKFYPDYLQTSDKFLIREYLQYKILEIIYDSEHGKRLVFMGGTCLRMVHGNNRFSEDLDFDNWGLDIEHFTNISGIVKKGLELEGYLVNIRVVQKNAFHCHVRFPGLLFQEGLSGHREETILIQLDTEPQNIDYQPDIHIINRFDVFTEINITPLSMLLSQKFYAVLNRKRNKGRDFYDIVFLLSLNVQPDWNYLNHKIGISNKTTLKDAVLKHCQAIDLNLMARDVEPFLFRSKDSIRVVKFPQIISQTFL